MKSSPLTDLTVADFLDRLASDEPTPGGGSAGALAGALAAALASMVCNLTLPKPEFAEVADEIKRLLDETEAARAGLEFGVEADAEAFGKVSAAYKLPRGSEAERTTRRAAIGSASLAAAHQPLEVARLCGRLLDVDSRLAEIGNPRVLSDVVVSAHLAQAALLSAAANVEVNLPSIGDVPFCEEARKELERLLDRHEAQVRVIIERVKRRT